MSIGKIENVKHIFSGVVAVPYNHVDNSSQGDSSWIVLEITGVTHRYSPYDVGVNLLPTTQDDIFIPFEY